MRDTRSADSTDAGKSVQKYFAYHTHFFLDQKIVPVNISMPVYVRNRIDRAARERGLTRSAFIVKAAEAFA